MRQRASLTVLAGSSARRRRRITNFSGGDFRATCVADIVSESVGQQLLQVFGRNEILVFKVFVNETRDIRAQRNNPEMFLASKIEREACKFCCQALSFQ